MLKKHEVVGIKVFVVETGEEPYGILQLRTRKDNKVEVEEVKFTEDELDYFTKIMEDTMEFIDKTKADQQ